jgi:hypothetical protein
MTAQRDRYKLSQFYKGPGTEIDYRDAQEITDDLSSCKNLRIVTLAMDFPADTTTKRRKEIEIDWIELLPKLDNVKRLSVRHRVNQDFFEAICQMKNLEELYFWTSTVDDISAISRMSKINRLGLDSFNRLTDISPILELKNLTHLSIENSFKIGNYEIIGQITTLIGLRLSGDAFAPKNLRLKSLIPFESLGNLKHLDLSTTSIIDKSFDCILKFENLERFDLTGVIPKPIRQKIKENHKTLTAGFFMDWDYENKKIYDEKEW